MKKYKAQTKVFTRTWKYPDEEVHASMPIGLSHTVNAWLEDHCDDIEVTNIEFIPSSFPGFVTCMAYVTYYIPSDREAIP